MDILKGYPSKVIYIKPDNRLKRLEFIEQHEDDNWDDVIFLDESYFYIGPPTGEIRYLRNQKPVDTNFTSSNRQKKVNILWGISIKYKLKPFFYEGAMNEDKYKEALMEILPDISKTGIKPYKILQDNATYHYSANLKKFYQDFGVPYFNDFPPYSPDLNPIEHLWSQLKHKRKNKNFKDENALKRFLKKEIKALSEAKIRNSILHLKKSFKIIKEKNGAIEQWKDV